jgi:hypothetical protein
MEDMLKTLRRVVPASKMRFGYYIHYIRFCSLIQGEKCLVRLMSVMLITTFALRNPQIYNITMFNLADCADTWDG